MEQTTLIDDPGEPGAPPARRATSKGIGAGDIVLVDKRGRIVERIVGTPDFGRLRELIERKLAEPA